MILRVRKWWWWCWGILHTRREGEPWYGVQTGGGQAGRIVAADSQWYMVIRVDRRYFMSGQMFNLQGDRSRFRCLRSVTSLHTRHFWRIQALHIYSLILSCCGRLAYAGHHLKPSGSGDGWDTPSLLSTDIELYSNWPTRQFRLELDPWDEYHINLYIMKYEAHMPKSAPETKTTYTQHILVRLRGRNRDIIRFSYSGISHATWCCFSAAALHVKFWFISSVEWVPHTYGRNTSICSASLHASTTKRSAERLRCCCCWGAHKSQMSMFSICGWPLWRYEFVKWCDTKCLNLHSKGYSRTIHIQITNSSSGNSRYICVYLFK